MESALHFIPLAFAALLPLINPVGSALILLGMIGPAAPKTYQHVAARVAIGMLIFIVLIELLGAWLLKFFGISMPVLQLAGGAALAAMGWNMLNARAATATDDAPPVRDEKSVMEQVFYPITFPLTVGPGVIVVVLTLSAKASDSPNLEQSLLAHTGVFVAGILLAALVYVCYAYAPRLAKLIPPHAASGIQRLISFVLLCIGVQIAWDGLATLLRTLQH